MTPWVLLDTRKAQLAEAIWQGILTLGVSAVPTRTIAEQAGVVVGALRHVFPSKTELVPHSADLVVHRAKERLLGTPWPDDTKEFALSISKRVLPLSALVRHELEVRMALMTEMSVLGDLVAV